MTYGVQYRSVFYAILTLVVIGVVAAALALTARDNEDERDVLRAVGAAPRAHRQVRTRQATLLAGSACAIGVPIGVAAVAAMVAVSNH